MKSICNSVKDGLATYKPKRMMWVLALAVHSAGAECAACTTNTYSYMQVSWVADGWAVNRAFLFAFNETCVSKFKPVYILTVFEVYMGDVVGRNNIWNSS